MLVRQLEQLHLLGPVLQQVMQRQDQTTTLVQIHLVREVLVELRVAMEMLRVLEQTLLMDLPAKQKTKVEKIAVQLLLEQWERLLPEYLQSFAALTHPDILRQKATVNSKQIKLPLELVLEDLPVSVLLPEVTLPEVTLPGQAVMVKTLRTPTTSLVEDPMERKVKGVGVELLLL